MGPPTKIMSISPLSYLHGPIPARNHGFVRYPISWAHLGLSILVGLYNNGGLKVDFHFELFWVGHIELGWQS